MLVNSLKFGSKLASTFSSSNPESPVPGHNVVLMANHGFTTLGTSIKQAVYRAVYTQVNASVQTNALIIRAAAVTLRHNTYGEMTHLGAAARAGSAAMNDATQDRPWALWVEEVKTCGLYKHEGRS